MLGVVVSLFQRVSVGVVGLYLLSTPCFNGLRGCRMYFSKCNFRTQNSTDARGTDDVRTEPFGQSI